MKYDVVIIGGGLAGSTVAAALLQKGKSVAVVAEGRSIHNVDYSSLEQNGCTLLMGDKVVSASFGGKSLTSVRTLKLGADFPLEASAFVLATGKYFGGGIKADMAGVYETLLGCDVEYDADSNNWFRVDFMEDQPFMKFGVKTDELGRALKNGVALENVYAAGEVLSGVSAADKESGTRILASASVVVNSICE